MMKRFSRITTTQIARICKVSQGTVDRALNDRPGIKAETKDKILRVAREYDYVPAATTKCATSGNSMLLGVVVYDLYNDHYSKLAMSFVNQAKKVGYSVIFLFSDKNIKNEKSAIDYLNYIGVDGIVLASVGFGAEYMNYLKSISKPIVLIGNKMGDLPRVGVDDFQAMKKLTEKLVADSEDGEEIVYFSPVLREQLDKDNAQIARYDGFKEAMKGFDRKYRVVTNAEEISQSDKNIICSTDYYVLRILQKHGFSEKRRLAGFDNIRYLRDMNVKVLTVDYSTDDIAVQCIKYVLGRRYRPTVDCDVVYNLEKTDE